MDMEEDQETFDKYDRFSWKSSPLAKECDEECKKNTICGIRAGKSELRCDYESDVFMGERYKPKSHDCAMNLLGVNARLNQ